MADTTSRDRRAASNFLVGVSTLDDGSQQVVLVFDMVDGDGVEARSPEISFPIDMLEQLQLGIGEAIQAVKRRG